MISQTPFVVVDLETTGLEPRLDRIIEVAAVKIQNGRIIDQWEQLINPGVFIPQTTTDITGITTEMLQGEPGFTEIADELIKFIGEESIFVAHNAEFDRSFLNFTLDRHDLDGLRNPYLCTFKLAKHMYPALPKYSLGALTERFNIQLDRAHRALEDARATAELLNHFMQQLKEGGAQHLHEIPTILNLPVRQEPDAQASLF